MSQMVRNFYEWVRATLMPGPPDVELSAEIPPKELQKMVEFRQLGNMKHRSSVVVIVRMFLSLVLAVLCWEASSPYMMLFWLAFNVMHTLACLKSADDFFNSPTANHDFSFWRNRTMQMTFVSGLIWGFAGFFFMQANSPVDHVVLMGIIFSVAFGSIPLYACWLPGLWSFLPAILLPPYLRFIYVYEISLDVALELLVIIVLTIVYFGRRLNQIFTASIYQSIEKELLMEQLIQQRQKAEFAREVAEVAIRNRTRFFAGANHDLRQPLQAMGIFISLLEESVEKRNKPLVENLAKACNLVSTLVDQILTISRLEAKSIKINPESFSIRSLLNDLDSEFQPIAQKKGLNFKIKTSDVTVFTDEVLLGRILRNLIGNAVRYCTRGDVLIRAKESRVGTLIISVADTGPGITQEEQSKLYSDFFRGKAGRSAEEGFGLGLSIVHKISALLDIKLSMHSRVGKGTIFRLELPIASDPKQVEVLQRATYDAIPQSLSGANILLIEDDTLIRQSIEALLVAWGANVTSASCYDAEITVPFLNGKPLDIILADYNLGPGLLTGLQAVFRIRSAMGRRIPAIVSTAVSRDVVLDQYEEETEGSNFSDRSVDLMSLPVIIQKPVSPQELNRAIFRLIPQNKKD